MKTARVLGTGCFSRRNNEYRFFMPVVSYVVISVGSVKIERAAWMSDCEKIILLDPVS